MAFVASQLFHFLPFWVRIRCADRSFFVWYMWIFSLSTIRFTLVWDRHDLAGLESMAQACGTRSLLHPYGTTGIAICGGVRMLA
jgi:hypothetical protein